MKKIILLLAIAFSLPIIAQDYGKISIRNRDASYPKFIASMNGVRTGNVYQTQATFEYLDEKNYKIKIFQEGNNYPLVFNMINTLKHQTSYVLNKDEMGNFTLASEGKTPFTNKDENVSNAVNNGNPGNATIVTNVPAPVNSLPGGSTSLENTSEINVKPKELGQSASMANSTNLSNPVINTGSGIMDDNSYNNIFNSIKKEPVDNNKMTTAKTFITQQNLSSEQVLGIVKLFSFESNRLSFAKWAYHKTLDKKNYIKVYDALTFASSKKDLSEYIKKNP